MMRCTGGSRVGISTASSSTSTPQPNNPNRRDISAPVKSVAKLCISKRSGEAPMMVPPKSMRRGMAAICIGVASTHTARTVAASPPNLSIIAWATIRLSPGTGKMPAPAPNSAEVSELRLDTPAARHDISLWSAVSSCCVTSAADSTLLRWPCDSNKASSASRRASSLAASSARKASMKTQGLRIVTLIEVGARSGRLEITEFPSRPWLLHLPIIAMPWHDCTVVTTVSWGRPVGPPTAFIIHATKRVLRESTAARRGL